MLRILFIAAQLFAVAFCCCVAIDAEAASENVVLVTLDGARWQEMFRGADPALAADKRYQPDPQETITEFVSVPDRRATLTPFMQDIVAKQGVLIGDRDDGSCAETSNPYWFSYPGYNEILTGRADPRVNNNNKINNANVTVLEWLNRMPQFRDRVRVYGSWNVFPYIVNRKRSGVYVNAAFEPFAPATTEYQKALNRLLRDIPSPWRSVRHDALTFNFAMESLRRDRPRVLYIALGETDEYAHMGLYDEYLRAFHRGDAFLRELWSFLQSDQGYAGNTTLIVTTDHGRGVGDQWRDHGSGHDSNGALVKPDAEVTLGSNQVWIAVMGPGVSAAGNTSPARYAPGACARLDQVTATMLAALGIDWRQFDTNIGAPLLSFAEGAKSR